MSADVGVSAHAAKSISMFNDRAQGYETANGGWHVWFGAEFVNWLPPARGASVLDLACGTGVVTIPAAKAVGAAGTVIGVDITSGMLKEARRKPLEENCARIDWIEHDITQLDDVEAVQKVVLEKGGFDVVCCCSALVLLQDPQAAIKQWARLLKSGGKMIVDVPIEDKTLQHLFTSDLREAVGISLPFDRSWVKDMYSLEKLYENAGLAIVKSFRSRSVTPEKWYDAEDGDAVFENETQNTYKSFAKEGKLEEARKAWPALWKKNLRGKGKFWDGHALYVTIGRKN